jgi:hypothetical protein
MTGCENPRSSLASKARSAEAKHPSLASGPVKTKADDSDRPTETARG